jgi:hypothetical protein
MNGRVGQYNEWPKRPADELIAIGRVQDTIIRRHLQWLKRHQRVFDCTAWEMCGCTTIKFIAHFEGLFDKRMTWHNYGEWSVDHIFPLSAIDPNLEEQIFAGFHYSNLRPLWLKENLRKGRKVTSALTLRSEMRRHTAKNTHLEIPIITLKIRNG